MNAVSELRAGLVAVAKRSVALAKACNNEESTRLYLLLPVIGLLGYDSSDPLEVYPNHEADPIGGEVHRADFAILSSGAPVIAFASTKCGADLGAKQPSLASYFGAWPSTKLGVLTNGLTFEFFVDATKPGVMDSEPFLTLDLQTIAQSGVSDEVIETLIPASKASFDADMIAELAHMQLVRKRLRTAFIEEAQSPSEEFSRVMMQRVGFAAISSSSIQRHYAPLIKVAFEEALVLPVVQRLRSASPGDAKNNAAAFHQVGQKIVMAERELAIFNYVRRRLAFLVTDEAAFAAIDRLDYKDYVGKLVVFLDRDPKGRLFDLIRGADGYDKFIFPDPHGEIVTNAIGEIDKALAATFAQRVHEMDLASPAQPRLARSA